ncbi:MAG: dTDP-glucose 4,6-dehydratase [Anaerolineaceae bacterium]
MQYVLVTGGAGFIGANFIHYLLSVEPTVQITNLDALTYAGSLENLTGLPDAGRHTFVHGNICDGTLLEKLFREKNFDTVVHFAAESHVDRSILGPMEFIQTNIVGTAALLDAARQAWISRPGIELSSCRFHHVSTDEVFGSLKPGEPAFTENTAYSPNSPYAASKASSDHLVRAYHATYGLPVTITNCSNNYGPLQFPEKLIPLTILNALAGKKLPVYGDGKQIRDWLYVEDHCEAIRLVLREGRTGVTYNIGGDNQPTNLEIVYTICEILDREKPDSPHKPHKNLIQFVTDRPGHDRRYAMDIDKIKRELGWQPSHTLRQGLEKTVAWYLAQFDRQSEILSRPDFASWMQKNYSKRGGEHS